jgi:hypothetical protein
MMNSPNYAPTCGMSLEMHRAHKLECCKSCDGKKLREAMEQIRERVLATWANGNPTKRELIRALCEVDATAMESVN